MTDWKLSNCHIVKRVRWVMFGTILFSITLTLLGQPTSFWPHPRTALRGDGLSIYDSTNRTFEFFLGHGWQPYLSASLVYLAAALLAVSLLPKTLALITAFSAIFAHYFGASLWLSSRWHLGAEGFILYAVVLGALLAFFVFPTAHAHDPIGKRLRWVMSGAILFDFTLTLAGQPGSYWLHPETVNESNPLFATFLVHGWIVGVLFYLVYLAAALLLVSVASTMTARVCIFALLFGHFNGASTWLFYRWRLGMEAPVLYAVLLSILIVWLAFSQRKSDQPAPPVE
jgi:hypothetical protein